MALPKIIPPLAELLPVQKLLLRCRAVNVTTTNVMMSMRLKTNITVLFFALPLAFVGELAADDLRPESATYFEDSIRPKLVTYCAACHEDNDSEGAVLFLTAKTSADMAKSRSVWSSVAEQLRNRTMPPADEDQPSEQDRLLIANWIDASLRQTACDLGLYAGAVTTRRLNRNEYDNTIRDLLGLDTDLAQRFPVDGSGGEGFDNNGETLFLPPVLMERYLEAATEAIDQTVIVPVQKIVREPNSFRMKDGQKALAKAEATSNAQQPSQLMVSASQTVFTTVRILDAGPYRLDLHLNAPFGASGKQKQPASDAVLSVGFSVDGIEAERLRLKKKDVQNQRHHSDVADVRLSMTLRLARGFHRLAFTALDRPLQLAKLTVTEQVPDYDQQQKVRHRMITGLTVGNSVKNAEQTAAVSLQQFAERAFRRPVSEEEMRPFLGLVNRSLERGDPFQVALKQGLRAVLVSPHFLFRIEPATSSEVPEPLTEHALATRLSYFLWSSLPDEKLFRSATEGRLSKPVHLATEVDRMLADPKAEAFFYQFTGQWLGTIEVGASVVPDTGKFKGQFNTELLMDFRDEPVRLFKYIIEEDRSLLELLDPGYAIVNSRLTKHYQLNGAAPPKILGNGWSSNPQRSKGQSFKRLDLKDAQRGGVLGMGGVHLLTSYPNRTSAVLRGGWVLETLLGVRIPSPPPDLPELPTKKGKKKLTAKESLALHRDHAACAACHNLMDPLGFSLENYDVLGRWRDKENNEPIDTSAVLPSGEKFRGLNGLRQVLVKRQDEFLHHLTGKMLGYALGRSLTDRDDCTIQQIVNAVKADDMKARTLVREVVLSVPFRMHQKPETHSP